MKSRSFSFILDGEMVQSPLFPVYHTLTFFTESLAFSIFAIGFWLKLPLITAGLETLSDLPVYGFAFPDPFFAEKSI